jgi:hypothetical protein
VASAVLRLGADGAAVAADTRGMIWVRSESGGLARTAFEAIGAAGAMPGGEAGADVGVCADDGASADGVGGTVAGSG